MSQASGGTILSPLRYKSLNSIGDREEKEGHPLLPAGSFLKSMKRVLGAEIFGTFCLVFAGTGAVVVNDTLGGAVTHVGVALTFGLIVLAMIYTLGEISGAHLNPAVTLGFWFSGRFESRLVALYIGAQLTGALLASMALRLLFPDHDKLGATLPSGTWLQSWVMEFILTLMLMVVILGVSSGSKEQGVLAGVAIGGVIALEALFGGPVCGASMNPARSMAPAVVSGHLEHLWVYISAPIAGVAGGVFLWKVVLEVPVVPSKSEKS